MTEIATTTPTVDHLDWRTLISAGEDTPPEILAALDSYFATFAQPELVVGDDGEKTCGNRPCIECGEPLAGGLLGFLTSEGGFEWGLVHGEGHCRKCRWPARAHHFVKDEQGEEILSLTNVVLQYHPDHVKRPSAAPGEVTK